MPRPESTRNGRGGGLATNPPPPGTPPGGAGQRPVALSETVDKLFQPQGSAAPSGNANQTGGVGEGMSVGGSSSKLGKTGRVPDVDDIEAIHDSVEREAVKKLEQAVRRIKANCDRRGNPPVGGPGSPPPDTRRDW